MPEEDLLSLFEAARWAPSAFNSQPWRFLYARRGEADWERFLGLLIPWNQSWAHSASALVYILSDTLPFTDKAGRAGDLAHPQLRCRSGLGLPRASGDPDGLSGARNVGRGFRAGAGGAGRAGAVPDRGGGGGRADRRSGDACRRSCGRGRFRAGASRWRNSLSGAGGPSRHPRTCFRVQLVARPEAENWILKQFRMTSVACARRLLVNIPPMTVDATSEGKTRRLVTLPARPEPIRVAAERNRGHRRRHAERLCLAGRLSRPRRLRHRRRRRR